MLCSLVHSYSYSTILYIARASERGAPGPVDDEQRTRHVLDPVDVREKVPRHGEAEVESHSERRRKRALQHNAPKLHPVASQLLRQLTRRPAAERSTVPVTIRDGCYTTVGPRDPIKYLFFFNAELASYAAGVYWLFSFREKQLL